MRAQASAEFLIVVSALMLFFVLFYTVYVDLLGNLSITRENLAATQRSGSLAAAANYVYLAGPGASINMSIPYNTGENLSLYGVAAESNIGEGHAQAPLILFADSITYVNSSDFVIRNSDGVIVIE